MTDLAADAGGDRRSASCLRGCAPADQRVQTESGLATDLTRAQIMISIVLPQALRNLV